MTYDIRGLDSNDKETARHSLPRKLENETG